MTESRGCHTSRRGVCSRGVRLRDQGYGRERNVSTRVHVCENVAKPMDQCERKERAASEQQDETVQHGRDQSHVGRNLVRLHLIHRKNENIGALSYAEQCVDDTRFSLALSVNNP